MHRLDPLPAFRGLVRERTSCRKSGSTDLRNRGSTPLASNLLQINYLHGTLRVTDNKSDNISGVFRDYPVAYCDKSEGSFSQGSASTKTLGMSFSGSFNLEDPAVLSPLSSRPAIGESTRST
jgi:hypothetical protein